jgi:hypothetical protein
MVLQFSTIAPASTGRAGPIIAESEGSRPASPSNREDRFTLRPLMILVAGPYRSGTNDDPTLIAKNVAHMTEVSLHLFRAGHLPVMGEWFALPLIEHAGSSGIGDATFSEIFHPISRRLVARCDACLRIGGPSAGADEMVGLAKQHGKTIFHCSVKCQA